VLVPQATIASIAAPIGNGAASTKPRTFLT
jgi:hypothetical protein